MQANQSQTPIHQDVVHDAQLDYYGNYLATCSSDRKIKIFEVEENSQSHICDLEGHQGPVWQVAWAHPKYGVRLASCSYDRRVIIWREQVPKQWVLEHESQLHSLSVNSIAWAPHQYGLCLVCGSSDGKLSVIVYNEEQQKWSETVIPQPGAAGNPSSVAHKIGVNAVSWAPVQLNTDDIASLSANSTSSPSSTSAAASSSSSSSASSSSSSSSSSLSSSSSSSSFDGSSTACQRIASGGCDGVVRIWSCAANGAWEIEQELLPSKVDTPVSQKGKRASSASWIRDVQFAPNVGSPVQTLAACSEDGKVIIWTLNGSKWEAFLLKDFQEPVWRLSWSTTGNLLAISSGESHTSVWKENIDGTWTCLSDILK